MEIQSRIGILDWGIGGVSIYKLIRERLGEIPITYFSDTGVTPYGKMTRPELVSRLNTVIEFLESRGMTHLVIGCNAASTAIADLQTKDLVIEGVIENAVAATLKLRPARLGLIGGRRTVLSGVYRRAFAKHGVQVKQRIAQPLSGLIESGDMSSQNLRDECSRILTPIRNCSHILLACTHYPAIIPIMRDFVSSKTIFIDPAKQLIAKVGKWDLPKNGDSFFLTSGDPAQMLSAAINAFGISIKHATRIKITD